MKKADSPPPHTPLITRCIQLAELGGSNVAPNPKVGALILHNKDIIGEGYHKKFGGPHAEVEAVNSVEDKSLLKEATLYASLEPCSHKGKTPACTDLILKHQIPTVVFGLKDPNDKVEGLDLLRSKGVKVIGPILAAECAEQNRRFIVNQKFRRPYIILKWAETADGFIAREDYSSKWISGEASRELVHTWRAEESSILVGTNTAHYDDPQLNVRDVQGTNPLRLVLDRSLRLSEKSKIYDEKSPTWVINESRSEDCINNLRFLKISFDKSLYPSLFKKLLQSDYSSILVEGGAQTINGLIAQNYWDECRRFISQTTFSTGIKAPKISDKPSNQIEIGEDKLNFYRNAGLIKLLKESV